jgi:hypothetical protein
MHGYGGRHKGQGLGDDLLLRPHPDEVQGHRQSHRAVDRRHREGRPGEGGDLLLERRPWAPTEDTKLESMHAINRLRYCPNSSAATARCMTPALAGETRGCKYSQFTEQPLCFYPG